MPATVARVWPAFFMGAWPRASCIGRIDLCCSYARIPEVDLADLFAQDPERFDKFTMRFQDLLFDYSKNRVTEKTMALLLELAQQAKLSEQIEAMFTGQKINTTEKRAVLHIALRNRSNRPILVD